jgi:hypothetical protein
MTEVVRLTKHRGQQCLTDRNHFIEFRVYSCSKDALQTDGETVNEKEGTSNLRNRKRKKDRREVHWATFLCWYLNFVGTFHSCFNWGRT